jgi:hypothetical protein
MKCSWPVAALLCAALVQAAHTQATSTPEERAGWAATSHQLESNPLDPAADAQGDAALKRVMDVHDFHVVLCTGFFNEFNGMHYTYQHVVIRQFMLGAAAFQVDNPDKAGDSSATNLYAVQSVLKAYGAILASKPDAKSKLLDDLAKKQNGGKLEEEVRKACH